jgi:hypothetical protein
MNQPEPKILMLSRQETDSLFQALEMTADMSGNKLTGLLKRQLLSKYFETSSRPSWRAIQRKLLHTTMNL